MNAIDSNNAQFLTAIDQLQSRASNAELQLSSGLRVSKPSDDPSAVTDILSLQSEIGSLGQVQSNLNEVKAEVDTSESSLEQAVQLLQQAVSLGAQGAGSTSSAQERQILSQQVQGLLEQTVTLSRTEVAGRYVFSGDDATQPPYDVNLENANGVDQLVTSPSTRLIEDASGITFSASKTAEEIFDHRNPDNSLASDNAFAALNQLQTALQNNDSTGIGNAITSLKAAQTWVSGELGFYGGVQNQVNSAITVAQQYQTQDQATLSTKRDADVPAEVLAMTQANTELQAAMSAQASRSSKTLFDYLQG